MIFTSKKCLLLQLLAITICCHGAPLGKKDRFIERKHLQRIIGESTENATPNEPIKILRSTDRDVIIQVRRTPLKQSREVGGRDDLQYSDESMYNKHKKSKLTSDESQGELTNGKVGEDIVNDRVSRLSMHRLPSTAEEFRSDELKIEDKIVHDLEEMEKEWSFEEQNDQENPKPSHFESQINVSGISDIYASDKDRSVKTSNENTRLKDLENIELSDEENNKDDVEFIEMNSSEDKWNSQENGSQTSKDRKNKRELNNGSFKMPEIKSLRERIIDLRKKSNPFKAKSSVDGLIKDTPFDLIRTKNTEAHTKHTPKLVTNSFKSISFKRNDILKTNKPKPRSTTEASILSTLDDRRSSSLLDNQEPLHKKVVHTRSPSFDSLQDLKRRITKERELASLLARKPVLLGRESPEDPRGPSYVPPPGGQYYAPQRPIIVIPTEDPVVQAERAHTALQRMILFVNAMGKFDYYVSNAARNFVDLMTSHTHDYDQTVRSRHADKEECGNKKDEGDDDDDVEEEEEDDKGGFVRIRASKSRRNNNINDRSREEQTSLRLRDRGNKW